MVCSNEVLRKQIGQYIDSAPVADVKEVVHSFWHDLGVINDYPEKGVNNYHLLSCDNCGALHRTRLQDNVGKPFNANYCPNCGAKMDSI